MTRWIARRIQTVDPQQRVRWAVRLLLFCVVAWPVSSFTVLREEPQGLLALSWLALILTCIDIIATTDVRDAAG